jgi:hypothetical protein
MGERIMRLIGRGSPFPPYELGIDPAIAAAEENPVWARLSRGERLRRLRDGAAAGMLATALAVVGPRAKQNELRDPEYGEVRTA